MPEATDTAVTPSVPVFAERFALGVVVGSTAVDLFQLQAWWAPSLAFTAFVLFLVLRWEREVRDPWGDGELPQGPNRQIFWRGVPRDCRPA